MRNFNPKSHILKCVQWPAAAVDFCRRRPDTITYSATAFIFAAGQVLGIEHTTTLASALAGIREATRCIGWTDEHHKRGNWRSELYSLSSLIGAEACFTIISANELLGGFLYDYNVLPRNLLTTFMALMPTLITYQAVSHKISPKKFVQSYREMFDYRDQQINPMRPRGEVFTSVRDATQRYIKRFTR